MFFVLLLLWIVFNGRLTWEIAAIGVALCAALYAFSRAFLGVTPKRELAALRLLPKLLLFVVMLVREIVRANLALTRMVLRRDRELKPQLITFRTPLTTNAARGALANAITLTPGTITALAEGDELTVHCLDERFAEGIDDTPFQRALLAMEKGGDKA